MSESGFVNPSPTWNSDVYNFDYEDVTVVCDKNFSVSFWMGSGAIYVSNLIEDDAEYRKEILRKWKEDVDTDWGWSKKDKEQEEIICSKSCSKNLIDLEEKMPDPILTFHDISFVKSPIDGFLKGPNSIPDYTKMAKKLFVVEPLPMGALATYEN